MSDKKSGTIRIRLIRSGIASPHKVRVVLKGLGLRKMQQVVEKPDNDGIRGMVAKVCHLVEIVE